MIHMVGGVQLHHKPSATSSAVVVVSHRNDAPFLWRADDASFIRPSARRPLSFAPFHHIWRTKRMTMALLRSVSTRQQPKRRLAVWLLVGAIALWMYFKSIPFLSNFVSISVQFKTENDGALAHKRSELTTRTSQHLQSSNGNNNSNSSNPLAIATATNESVTNESGSLTPNNALLGSAVSKNAEELSNGSESPMTTAPTDNAMPSQSPTMPPSPVVATASVAPKEGWTDVLQNLTNYFWGNKEGLHFSTDLSMDAVNARLSIRVTLVDPSQQCPFPSFRSRLSGTSMVHIVLDNPDYRGRGVSGRTNASEAVLTGSVWIPVPGLYFLDILLVHCTMDAYNASVTPEELKTKCPVTLDIRRGI